MKCFKAEEYVDEIQHESEEKQKEGRKTQWILSVSSISFWPNLKHHQQRSEETVLIRFIIILRNQDGKNKISVIVRPKEIQYAELISMTVTVSCLTSDTNSKMELH